MRRNKTKKISKEWKLNMCQDQIKEYKRKRTFEDNERKFYQKVGGEIKKTTEQTEAKEDMTYME